MNIRVYRTLIAGNSDYIPRVQADGEGSYESSLNLEELAQHAADRCAHFFKNESEGNAKISISFAPPTDIEWELKGVVLNPLRHMALSKSQQEIFCNFFLEKAFEYL